MEQPFARLRAAYDDRLAHALRTKREGRRVVGYVGNTVPVEVILAADCFPVRVAPVSGTTATSDRYVEPISDPDVRYIFQDYLDGALAMLDLLVVPRSTEPYHKLFLALREAWRTGLVASGPKPWLYDILHTQRPSSRDYGIARTRELLAELGGASERALSQAIAATNTSRALLARLQSMRVRGDAPVSGEAAQIASGAARFMPLQEHNEALVSWLENAPARKPGVPRLLVKGCPLEHAELHRLVEDVGGVVVEEDDDWGTRSAEPRIAAGGDPLAAIFDYYYRDVPCPRIHPEDVREAWFLRALQQRHADAVLFYLPRPDDIHGWSFPKQRDLVARAGLPWTLVRDDARDTARRPALAAQLREFMRSISHG